MALTDNDSDSKLKKVPFVWAYFHMFQNRRVVKHQNYSTYKIYITSEPTALILLRHFQESEQADDLALTVHLMKQR